SSPHVSQRPSAFAGPPPPHARRDPLQLRLLRSVPPPPHAPRVCKCSSFLSSCILLRHHGFLCLLISHLNHAAFVDPPQEHGSSQGHLRTPFRGRGHPCGPLRLRGPRHSVAAGAGLAPSAQRLRRTVRLLRADRHDTALPLVLHPCLRPPHLQPQAPHRRGRRAPADSVDPSIWDAGSPPVVREHPSSRGARVLHGAGEVFDLLLLERGKQGLCLHLRHLRWPSVCGYLL
uniref:Uncharacterized protein n=1 Tax=Aegilops tauschii subsp. strangulata TaxID=200361 RepID=A0A453JDA5_AEGTS